ncbi:hypothetical protein [Streptomyces carpinensis]|uniref:Uncharacterized protein n=1 Tax=Streptomyces carpinensis TaxID=66369 RepID=A0ABV1VUT2_9ACTN|nr:hypothetical protein [Streptomyces carpinensis]
MRLHTGLPDGVARGLELNILAALLDAGERPIRGQEYFPDHTLALILDLVDNHPAIRPQSVVIPAPRRGQLPLW